MHLSLGHVTLLPGNFIRLNSPLNRTYGAGQTHVGLCSKFLVSLKLLLICLTTPPFYCNFESDLLDLNRVIKFVVAQLPWHVTHLTCCHVLPLGCSWPCFVTHPTTKVTERSHQGQLSLAILQGRPDHCNIATTDSTGWDNQACCQYNYTSTSHSRQRNGRTDEQHRQQYSTRPSDSIAQIGKNAILEFNFYLYRRDSRLPQSFQPMRSRWVLGTGWVDRMTVRRGTDNSYTELTMSTSQRQHTMCRCEHMRTSSWNLLKHIPPAELYLKFKQP